MENPSITNPDKRRMALAELNPYKMALQQLDRVAEMIKIGRASCRERV